MAIVVNMQGRGKNRDEYGNPYWACSVRITEEGKIISQFDREMQWGDSSEKSVLEESLKLIPQSFLLKHGEITIKWQYKHATKDSELEHPEKWRF